MLRRISLLLTILCLSTSLFAAKATRVIYVTLDGVRWQDIFQDPQYFPKLWGQYAAQGIFYGNPATTVNMETASIPVSLPSYQTQLVGAVQPCDNNACGRVTAETFTENLIHRGFAKKDVATFSSWSIIDDAVESVPGTTYANTGMEKVYDPVTGKADEIMEELNRKQTLDHPLKPTRRYDKYTFDQAMHYLEKYQPRFLWISFDDADEEAHLGNLKGYHEALALYDDLLDQLFTKLNAMHLDQETLVIVTTDHGRGDGKHWTSHGTEYPESKQTWAFVMNGELKLLKDKNHFDTLSIRPTVEGTLLG